MRIEISRVPKGWEVRCKSGKECPWHRARIRDRKREAVKLAETHQSEHREFLRAGI